MIITIDGPSGTGKSTIAKALAECLNFSYCNTGVMYRTLAYTRLHTLWAQTPIHELLENPPFSFRFLAGQSLVAYLGDHRISLEELRSQKVANMASELSQLEEVRLFMQRLQKEYARFGSCVFEGRDMGSKVFPNADVKIFLTASPEIRALRRLKELPDPHLSKQQLYEEMAQRDANDSQRIHDPLLIPDDAVVIDSSHLTIDQVLAHILTLIPRAS